jgi:CRP-like cAMP-binding protein
MQFGGVGTDIRSYRDGEHIFDEGDEGQHLFIVVRGAVRILKGGEEFSSALGTCCEGEIIGELAVVDSHPRSATAVALGETELAVFDRESFLEAIRARPELALEVIASLGRKLRHTNEDLQETRAAYVRLREEINPGS